MATGHSHAREYLDALEEALAPKDAPLPPRVPSGSRVNPKAIDRRWGVLDTSDEVRSALLGSESIEQMG